MQHPRTRIFGEPSARELDEADLAVLIAQAFELLERIELVEAYVPDTLVERVEGGRACRVMPTSSRSARKGRIRALGSSLVPLPDGLTSELTSGSSWRLPIEVELDPEGTGEGPTLRPNLRVKVVVPRPAAREPAADAPR